MRLNCIFAALVLAGVPLSAATVSVDCSRGQSLQSAINGAWPGTTLHISGNCSGAVVINTKNLTLLSYDKAIIDGQTKDAVTVNGPASVAFIGLTIQHGRNGITGQSGAQLTLQHTAVQNNSSNGIFLAGSSSATISDSSTNGNGTNGLDAEASSSVILTNTYSSDENGVFGVNINASSSLTFSNAQVMVSRNILGIQIGTSAAAFISDPLTTITVKDNGSTGLTIVSGAHMVAFGGTILSAGNQIHGVSIDSKAGLDLDAAAILTSTGNGGDGVHLEETSVLTMFNTPAFSGAKGVTTINTQGNRSNGISVLTSSNLTVIHQAAINSLSNFGDGIEADNGSSVTLIGSTVTGNATDIALSFGSRGDIKTSTFGSLTCDASVLLRGDTGRTCK